jgi:hypothetical protein
MFDSVECLTSNDTEATTPDERGNRPSEVLSIMYENRTSRDFAHFVTSPLSIGCARDCRYVLNGTDIHPRQVQHEVVLGSQAAASELSPPL